MSGLRTRTEAPLARARLRIVSLLIQGKQAQSHTLLERHRQRRSTVPGREAPISAEVQGRSGPTFGLGGLALAELLIAYRLSVLLIISCFLQDTLDDATGLPLVSSIELGNSSLA